MGVDVGVYVCSPGPPRQRNWGSGLWLGWGCYCSGTMQSGQALNSGSGNLLSFPHLTSSHLSEDLEGGSLGTWQSLNVDTFDAL